MKQEPARTDAWAPYEPDEVSSPGATLRETLEAIPLSQTELALRTGLSVKHVNQLVAGTAALTHETAIKLERATGVPASLWNALESAYRDWLSRDTELKALAANTSWLKRMPIADLRRRGIVTVTAREPARQLREVLTFFGVSSPSAWEEAWAQPTASFLQSSAFTADAAAVAAWLRLGELEAAKIDTAPYDKAALRRLIPELRNLTVLQPEEFWPEIQKRCAQVGVAVVLIPSVKGAHASGATRWLSPTKAVVQLSARHKRNDHFWFALFHELGHVLLHGKKEVFVEDKLGEGAGRQDEEREANTFASTTLIPASAARRLDEIETPADAVALAAGFGIHPGIVAGRIQHDREQWTFGVSQGLFTSLEIVESPENS
ncbi:ImmA/IrrE family metallo-endopeptidase [Gryllotalpicola koreensis]|uniref:ImmA/IrrE family metallo-endopeptidase n=1 Tax=Gryllotalpicola koreensis TaxID=993086 RepID=A0ABP7ZQK0_9MICO